MSRAASILFVQWVDGASITHHLPVRLEVCGTCRGHGTRVNPSIDGNGITSSEMDELGDDFRDDYMAGIYDVQCSTCEGRNVVPVVDEDRADPVILEAYYADMEDAAREDASEARLRRMESGEAYS